MLFHYTRNNVATTVAVPRTAGDPTLTVADGTRFGDRFPLLATVARRTTRAFQGINIVVAEAILCILEVTGRTGNTLTTSGAIEETTDTDMVVGDVVEMRPTALPISELQDAVVAIQATAHDLTFVYTQATPAATWTIVHRMGKKPAVMVVDSADSEVIGQVTYIDLDTLRIDFSGGFSGAAYLN